MEKKEQRHFVRFLPVGGGFPQKRSHAPLKMWSQQTAPGGCSGCQSPYAAQCHPAGLGTTVHRHDCLEVQKGQN